MEFLLQLNLNFPKVLSKSIILIASKFNVLRTESFQISRIFLTFFETPLSPWIVYKFYQPYEITN